MKNSLFKSTLRQAALLLVAAAIPGIVANLINPRGVAISFSRPAIVTADDSLFATDLGETIIGVSDATEPAPGDGPAVISTEQLARLIESGTVRVLDARIPEEFSHGHIPGAISIPFEQLGEFIDIVDQLPKDQWIVTYCDGPPCDLGELLANELMFMGFPKVAVYSEGLNEWKKQGNKVES